MRKVIWTTTRWRIPGELRRERIRELLAKSELQPWLGDSFVGGLEKRKQELDRLQWRLLTIQAPIFLFLAFSLLNINVNVSVLGISSEASKSLREVLLLLSSTFGLISSLVGRDLAFVKEILKAAVEKRAGNNLELRDVLEARYGIASMNPMLSYSKELQVGRFQWALFSVFATCGLIVLAMLVTIVFAVQLLNLVEVYLHSNVSREAAYFVVVFVLLTDAAIVALSILTGSIQPYQTYEDFYKLNKLSETDEAKYKAIIREIVKEHRSKGLVRRIFGRPKMKKMSDYS